jgi:hypothetical protein
MTPFNRRPIPRSTYQYQPGPKGPSLRFDLILDGAVRVYKDAVGKVLREVCQDSPAGHKEYNRRLDIMLTRQHWQCCLCTDRIRTRSDATFEHQRRRGMGAAFRDDRIYNERGEWMNGAAHWVCNGEKG